MDEKVLGDTLADFLPGLDRFLDRNLNKKRYMYAIRMFLDLRKKNPGNARQNLVKAAQIANVEVRTLDRLFRDLVAKGKFPKHLIDYWPTFKEDME